MSEIKWIKLTTTMFDDEKIKLIESMPEKDTILIIWIKLLVLAGKANNNGYIYLSENIPYTVEMLATVFNRPLNTVRLSLETLRTFGMIEVDEKQIINISNWEKHQNIDGMKKIREQNRKRVAKHREKKKMLQESSKKTGNEEELGEYVTGENITSNGGNENVTLRNSTEEDKEEDKDKKEDKELEEDGEKNKGSSLPNSFPSDIHRKIFESKVLSEIAYKTWFENTVIRDDTKITVVAANECFKIGLRKYCKVLESALNKKIEIVVE
ncbi:phage replisome organizer N-terminal domain-containing protein [Oceanirhabdus sp. W0125-5]|uniref:phage replisome organizer N-terminal domain-containing protein n=1 Tax=Oceanirhabdus sp. W0125-5 TaxID=2999116 RepID=UPI0022F32E31|nr:phage replisome organizer N-terminal domain-containing protein [Oceanirhabdus sp. W0125-5]WBW95275.1 phage replisome organizer N-terminal domain-containing protein [Oceanirhabdus sp. W0125-5]